MDGGAGNDTLTITLRADPDDVASVTIKNIETVIAQVSATDATGGVLDASQWTGVATLSNAGSTGGSLLSVSGLDLTTTVKAVGNTDVTIGYDDLSGSADTASVTLDRFGTGTCTTVSNTGTLTISDGLETLNLAVSGTAYLNLEAGDSLKTVNVSGAYAMTFTTDDAITSFNASTLAATSSFTFAGTSDLAFVGGDGNDTIALGSTLTDADSINGGNGTDTVSFTLAIGTAQFNGTSIETVNATMVNGAVLDVSGQGSISTLALTVAAVADVEVYNLNTNATVRLQNNNLSGVAIDTVPDATVTVRVGSGATSAAAGVGIDILTITDPSVLNITTVASGGSITVIDSMNTLKTVDIAVGGTADLTIGSADFSGVETVSLHASGSAILTFGTAGGSILGSTAITTFTLSAEGSGIIDVSGSAFEDVGSAGSKLDAVTITAVSGAAVYIDSLIVGTGDFTASGTHNNSLAIVITAGDGSEVAGGTGGSGALGIAASNAQVTLTLTALSSGLIDLGDVMLGGNGNGTANASLTVSSINIGTTGTVAIGAISGTAAVVTFGGITLEEEATLTIGDIELDDGTLNLGTITVGTGADVTIANVTGASTVGAIAINLADGASASIGNGGIAFDTVTGSFSTIAINATGTAAQYAQGTLSGAAKIGQVTVTLGEAASASFGDIKAASSIAGVTVNVGTAAQVNFDEILTPIMGAVSIQVAAGGSAEFTTTASTADTISSITISAAGVVDIHDLAASGGIGAISIRLTGEDAAVTVAGQIGSDAGYLSTVSLTVATGSDLVIEAIDASSMGKLTIAGAGNITINDVSGASVAGIDLGGMSGTFTGDFSDVAGAMTVSGGHGTNVITLGAANDTVRLLAGSGTDTIVYDATGQGSDTIYNFGTADKILVYATGFALLNGSGSLVTGTVTGIDFLVVSAGSATMAATDNVIYMSASFANATAMLAAVVDGGVSQITFQSAASADGNVIVVWSDGTSSYVTTVELLDGDAVFSADAAIETIAVISGVSGTALVTANFALFVV